MSFLRGLKMQNKAENVPQSLILTGVSIDKLKKQAFEIIKSLGGKSLIIENIENDYIKEIRKIYEYARAVYKTPMVIIIDGDNLFKTTPAQNAFLKVFEEPNPNVYLFILSTQPQKLLPTIHSRAATKAYKFFDEEPRTTNWFELSKTQQMKKVFEIKERNDAVELLQDIAVIAMRDPKYRKNLNLISDTLDNIIANGNIKLQLTNLIMNMI